MILAVISVLAGVAAWVPAVFVFDTGPGSILPRYYTLRFLPVALAGSCGIGLPVAALCLYLAGAHLRRSPGTVFLMANFAGAVLLLASYVLEQEFGLIALGVPSVIAANTFALLGWLWILKPQREAAGG